MSSLISARVTLNDPARTPSKRRCTRMRDLIAGSPAHLAGLPHHSPLSWLGCEYFLPILTESIGFSGASCSQLESTPSPRSSQRFKLTTVPMITIGSVCTWGWPDILIYVHTGLLHVPGRCWPELSAMRKLTKASRTLPHWEEKNLSEQGAIPKLRRFSSKQHESGSWKLPSIDVQQAFHFSGDSFISCKETASLKASSIS